MQRIMIALDYLPLIILGAVLGVLGQCIRALIGLRKVFLIHENSINAVNIKYLLLSLLMGLVIGCCSVLIIHQDFDEPLSNHQVMLIIALGYAGTDTVEGFFFPKRPTKSPGNHNPSLDD